MRAIVWTEAARPRSTVTRNQHHRTVRVVLPAEQVLHDSAVIEGVLDALFDRLCTTTVVVCVHPPQEAHP
jgi:hypothetical protein